MERFTPEQEQARLLVRLNEAMAVLLSRQNASSRSVTAYLHNLKVRYRLGIDEFDLLHLAYERVVELIERDKVTYATHLTAYLKKVAFNIAREKQRQNPSYYPLNEEICPALEPDKINEELELVAKAMEQLEEKDRYLLTLKIVEQMSWDEIHQLWCQVYPDKKLSKSSLRKRKQRALTKLRHIYHGKNYPQTVSLS